MILDLLDFYAVAQLVTLGLLAGTLGGMLGVGGSVVTIPGLTFILGYNQHVYQAAAMITNVAVSVPAAMRHHRAGVLVLSRLRWMIPVALVGVAAGVWLSNLTVFRGAEGGRWLGRILAAFLLYVIARNLFRLVCDRDQGSDPGHSQDLSEAPQWRFVAVGGITGTIAGLLGIGGGAVAVPLQHAWLGLSLRACIANSSTLICITAAVGAFYKNSTLYLHNHHWHGSFAVALVLAPTCWLGGHLGAWLTHYLPIKYVRTAFIGLLIFATVKMASIPWARLIG